MKPSDITYNQQKPLETTQKPRETTCFTGIPCNSTGQRANKSYLVFCCWLWTLFHNEESRITEATTRGILWKRCSENFAKLTGKRLCWSLFFDNRNPTQNFFCEFCKLFRAYFLQNTSRRLLLYDKTRVFLECKFLHIWISEC